MGLRRNTKVELLKGVSLFSTCNRGELGRIASLADEAEVPEGYALTREGRVGQEFFVIVDGEADVTIRKHKLATLGPGGWFGEMSLLDHGPRAATVTARTPMHLLVLDPASFAQLLSDAPQVTRKILKGLAQRIREVEQSPVR